MKKSNYSKALKAGSLALACLSLSACLANPPRPLTPEEEAMRRQMMQAFLNNMNGVSQQAPVQAPQTETFNIITEEELAQAINAVPAESRGVHFERLRDGIKIDGSMYLDPEGEISFFGSNNLTGEFTYIVKTEPGKYLIKYNRAGSNAEPVLLAKVERDNGSVRVKTVTGKNLSGEGVMPGSRGFFVARQASGFGFDPLSGMTTFSAEEGFHIARFQNGDVNSTGYILLERDEDKVDNPVGAVKGIFDSVVDAGNAFGVIDSAANDYMLVNIKTGEKRLLDITVEGKQVGNYSNCKRQNDFVNKCANVDFHESLFRQDGSPNVSHYFWKVYWFNTHDGNFVVAQEAGLRKITITDLTTGDKVTAMERALGIQSFNVNQSAEGTISINAKLGFSSESIPDALEYFYKNQHLAAAE